MPTRYVLGLDLGPPGEPTGFAVLEEPGAEVPPPEPIYNLRHLERFPPGTSYPAIIEAVVERASSPALRGSPLVTDWTAVGKDLIDRLRRAKLAVVPVTVKRQPDSAAGGRRRLAGAQEEAGDRVTTGAARPEAKNRPKFAGCRTVGN